MYHLVYHQGSNHLKYGEIVRLGDFRVEVFFAAELNAASDSKSLLEFSLLQ